jgi:GntR family transcriptional regulator, transcriptional repressor for pyruvate dehydrogenase complex
MASSIDSFVPIHKTTLVNQVMDRLKELISSGVYKPGDKLPTENELAAQFGVGRSSIRETIKVFNYLGVLESKSAKGTFVCPRSAISREALTWALLLGKDDIEMIIDLRGAMELWSFLRLANEYREAKAPVDPLLASLRETLGEMARAVAAGDTAAIIQADYDFHRKIIEGASNILFVEFYDILRSFLLAEIEESQGMYGDRSVIITEHEALCEALVSGDATVAERACVDHIDNVKRLLGLETRLSI